MAINAVSGSPDNGATVEAPIAVKTGNNQLGKDDFMKLLVAQLKNQDPNSPVDTKEMVTQLSQLTSVEQLEKMSAKLDTLTAATNSSAANSSSALIGKTITGVADTVHLTTTGGVAGAVNLLQNATKATVSVLNSSGRVVKTIDLTQTSAGPHPINWDGSTDSGERAEAGQYTLQVAATDGTGAPVDTDMSVSGIVSQVFYENGYPELSVNGARVPLTNLTSISQ